MNITIGFIVLFLVLFLPGLIFRRFYYLGEFSKQIIPDEHILRTLTFSIIPSAALQVIGLIVYNSIFELSFDLKDFILFYKDLVSDSSLPDSSLDVLSNDVINAFFIYQGGVYLASFFLAGISYFLVRKLGLDTRLKLLRFKNQWAYIFSAEILKFEKFRSKSLTKSKFLISYVDVLIRKNERQNELYSGYVIDYDLDPKDIHQIDRLYLAKAKRFKKESIQYSTSPIPGEFFIILGSEILNINVTYVVNKRAEKSRKKTKNAGLMTYNVLLLVTILFSFPVIIFDLEFLPFYPDFLGNLHWFVRLGIWFTINLSYGILFPFKYRPETRRYTFIGRTQYAKDIFRTAGTSAIVYGLIWLFSH